jgi:uncharacterized phage protein gp47/JayE
MPTIGPIDYSSRDYASLVADMQASIPTLLPEWTNTSDNDFGIALLQMFAYVGDITNYYIDRVANEMFLATATRRTSIINIAKMLNYTPVAMAPATVQLRFTTVTGSGAVTIPAGTQVATGPIEGETIIFETDEELIIEGADAATPQYTGDVGATQGETIADEVLTASSTGEANQEYSLFTADVIAGSVEVVVTEASGISMIWTEVSSLLNSVGTARVYDTIVDENDIMHIRFGDDVNGRIPPIGSEIVATYRVGIGTRGNVGAELITQLVAPIAGMQSVTNQQAAANGADAESIDSMRTSIPRSLTALQRAVTLPDYEALAIQVPGVAKAQADASIYTTVLLYIAPVGGGVPTAELGDDVVDYFETRKLVNVTVVPLDPTYVGVNVSATVNVSDNYFQTQVRTAVEDAINNLLLFENVDFDQNVTISQIYHAIQGVEGVDYAVLTLLIRDDAATQAGVQDVELDIGEIPETGTITLSMSGGVS